MLLTPFISFRELHSGPKNSERVKGIGQIHQKFRNITTRGGGGGGGRMIRAGAETKVVSTLKFPPLPSRSCGYDSSLLNILTIHRI